MSLLIVVLLAGSCSEVELPLPVADMHQEITVELCDYEPPPPPPPPPKPVVAPRDVEGWRSLVAAHFGSMTERALCLLWHESRGDPNATSRAGARGLMQVMPFWAEHLGLSANDLYDPNTNLKVARFVYDQQGWTAWDPYKRGECR